LTRVKLELAHLLEQSAQEKAALEAQLKEKAVQELAKAKVSQVFFKYTVQYRSSLRSRYSLE
jgi:hypothetical protein